MDYEILVIGYDPQAKKQVVDSLAGNELQVRVMPNGLGATLVSCLPQVDLVVLDASPAEIGRWEELRTIRSRSSVPVIALVSDSDYRVRIDCLDNGADYVLTKPFDKREMRARVGALLRRVRMTTQLVADLGKEVHANNPPGTTRVAPP